jgi:hypothetical protein
MSDGMEATMTVEGNISRKALIDFALRKMENVEERVSRATDLMVKAAHAAEAEEQYATLRELKGEQQAYRAVLEAFQANTVIPRPKVRGMVAEDNDF